MQHSHRWPPPQRRRPLQPQELVATLLVLVLVPPRVTDRCHTVHPLLRVPASAIRFPFPSSGCRVTRPLLSVQRVALGQMTATATTPAMSAAVTMLSVMTTKTL